MKQDSKILVIDDNKDVLFALKLLIQEHFNGVDTFKSPNVLPGQLREETYDAILLDMIFVAGMNTGNEGFYWLNKIFVPFYTTKKDGSGIGLNLARQIMLQHRGRIGLSSSVAKGTTFRLEF